VANELIGLIDRVNNAIRSERVMRIAVSSVLSIHKPRIFEKGTDASNTKIGVYGTNPISISKKNQAKQTGKTYFKSGYAEYKKDIGRNPGFVILRNTDQMMIDYGMIVTGGQFGLGFQNELNYNKSIWMQEKYDKQIFGHNDQELQVLTDVLTFEVNRSI